MSLYSSPFCDLFIIWFYAIGATEADRKETDGGNDEE